MNVSQILAKMEVPVMIRSMDIRAAALLDIAAVIVKQVSFRHLHLLILIII